MGVGSVLTSAWNAASNATYNLIWGQEPPKPPIEVQKKAAPKVPQIDPEVLAAQQAQTISRSPRSAQHPVASIENGGLHNIPAIQNPIDISGNLNGAVISSNNDLFFIPHINTDSKTDIPKALSEAPIKIANLKHINQVLIYGNKIAVIQNDPSLGLRLIVFDPPPYSQDFSQLSYTEIALPPDTQEFISEVNPENGSPSLMLKTYNETTQESQLHLLPQSALNAPTSGTELKDISSATLPLPPNTRKVQSVNLNGTDYIVINTDEKTYIHDGTITNKGINLGNSTWTINGKIKYIVPSGDQLTFISYDKPTDAQVRQLMQRDSIPEEKFNIVKDAIDDYELLYVLDPKLASGTYNTTELTPHTMTAEHASILLSPSESKTLVFGSKSGQFGWVSKLPMYGYGNITSLNETAPTHVLYKGPESVANFTHFYRAVIAREFTNNTSAITRTLPAAINGTSLAPSFAYELPLGKTPLRCKPADIISRRDATPELLCTFLEENGTRVLNYLDFSEITHGSTLENLAAFPQHVDLGFGYKLDDENIPFPDGSHIPYQNQTKVVPPPPPPAPATTATAAAETEGAAPLGTQTETASASASATDKNIAAQDGTTPDEGILSEAGIKYLLIIIGGVLLVIVAGVTIACFVMNKRKGRQSNMLYAAGRARQVVKEDSASQIPLTKNPVSNRSLRMGTSPFHHMRNDVKIGTDNQLFTSFQNTKGQHLVINQETGEVFQVKAEARNGTWTLRPLGEEEADRVVDELVSYYAAKPPEWTPTDDDIGLNVYGESEQRASRYFHDNGSGALYEGTYGDSGPPQTSGRPPQAREALYEGTYGDGGQPQTSGRPPQAHEALYEGTYGDGGQPQTSGKPPHASGALYEGTYGDGGPPQISGRPPVPEYVDIDDDDPIKGEDKHIYGNLGTGASRSSSVMTTATRYANDGCDPNPERIPTLLGNRKQRGADSMIGGVKRTKTIKMSTEDLQFFRQRLANAPTGTDANV